MPKPPSLLPLPFFALAVLKHQMCPHCHLLFKREDVTHVGLCTKDVGGNSHPPYFFYCVACRGCEKLCPVSFRTQGAMTIKRFAAECERGWHFESTGGVVVPPVAPKDPELDEALRDEAIFHTRHRRDADQPHTVQPSIRAGCPSTPIDRQVLAAAIRQLRAYSFCRTASSFPRLMMRFGVSPDELDLPESESS